MSFYSGVYCTGQVIGGFFFGGGGSLLLSICKYSKLFYISVMYRGLSYHVLIDLFLYKWVI